MTREVAQMVEDQIKANRAAIPADVKAEFCKIWPDVAEGLGVVETILKAIPVAVVAVPFIAAAISVGNSIHKSVCGS
jgi:hypothetical protein